jgi:hypothetical protein
MRGCGALVMRATLGLVFLLAAGAAYADESGVLAGQEKSKVQRCGAAKGSLTWDVVLFLPGGTWTANVGGDVFNGTSVATGKGGKRDLTFDAASEDAFIDSLQSRARIECSAPGLLVTSSERKKFQLKVNKNATKAKVILSYKFLGSDGGQDGKGKYAAKAKGAWGPVP